MADWPLAPNHLGSIYGAPPMFQGPFCIEESEQGAKWGSPSSLLGHSHLGEGVLQ